MDTLSYYLSFFFFFFNDTATTEIYTLSLHDALPIWPARGHLPVLGACLRERRYDPSTCTPDGCIPQGKSLSGPCGLDRKSTRLNSSHANISYAVFCLKKKKYIKYILSLCYFIES